MKGWKRWAAVVVLLGAVGLSIAQCPGSQTIGPAQLHFVKPKSDATDKLIVFVHGFNSDSTEAWTSSSGAYWPDLIANDAALKSFAVLTAGFNSPLLKRAQSIEEAANTLSVRLLDEHIYENFNKIVFIGHSTGGIMIRRILTRLYSPTQLGFLKRVSTVFFFATPTSGAPVADWVKWVSANPQTRDLSADDFSGVLMTIDTDWQDLIRDRHTTLNGLPRVYCGYEVYDTKVGAIVPRVYSATYCDQTPFAFNRDHSTLVKPLNAEDDDVYTWTKARLIGSTRRSGPVLWDAGEELGEVIGRLRTAFEAGQVEEQVVIMPEAADALTHLFVPLGSYERNSWAELFQTVATSQTCMAVRVDPVTFRAELTTASPVVTCRRGDTTWTACHQAACNDRP